MPRTANSMPDYSLLTAALEGLELQKQRIDEQIREVRLLLGKTSTRRGRPPGSKNGGAAAHAAPTTKRSRLSPAARKRIAAAQKRRWAEYRKSTSGKSA
jgi:hypothetical protein